MMKRKGSAHNRCHFIRWPIWTEVLSSNNVAVEIDIKMRTVIRVKILFFRHRIKKWIGYLNTPVIESFEMSLCYSDREKKRWMASQKTSLYNISFIWYLFSFNCIEQVFRWALFVTWKCVKRDFKNDSIH